MKNNILFIHHGVGIGGASICLRELVLSLKNEIEPTVICIKNGPATKMFKDSGINTIVLDSFFYKKIYSIWVHLEGTTYSSTFIFSFIKIFISYFFNQNFYARAVLRKYKADIVYLNTTFLTDWASAAKKEGKKVIMHVREPLGKGAFGLRRLILQNKIKKNIDYIIAISRDNANRINYPEKTTIIYDPMRKPTFGDIISISPKYKYFLYLGGLQSIKGFYTLTSALPYLNNEIKIFVAGDLNSYKSRKGIIGMIKKAIEKYWVKKLRKSEKIIEIGLVSNVYDYLKASQFLLFPSTIPHFAGPVMEAYRIGKPVIVSDVDGMNEIVNDRTGIFFKKCNSKDFATRINNSANMPKHLYDKFSESCYQKYDFIYSDNPSVIDVIRKLIP